MKILVFLLVLANLLFFAYAEGHFGRPDNPDAARVEQQLNADKIRVVARGEPPAAAARERKEEPVVAREAAPVCLAWSGLAVKDADRLGTLLGEKFSDFKLSRHPVAVEGGSWWVFIPPAASKADADRKAGELKRMGISDYFIIQEAGPNRFAISLGVFSSETGAGDRLAEIRAKGVKSARTGPRGGKDVPLVLEARGPVAAEAAVREAAAPVVPENSGPQRCK